MRITSRPGASMRERFFDRAVTSDHLEAVPFAVNVLRGVGPTAINAAKTHCKHGHPFDEENTYTRPKSGNRDCRKCIADRIRKSKQRKRDAA